MGLSWLSPREEVRERGCYCPRCFPGNMRQDLACSNGVFVDKWRQRKLERREAGLSEDMGDDEEMGEATIHSQGGTTISSH